MLQILPKYLLEARLRLQENPIAFNLSQSNLLKQFVFLFQSRVIQDFVHLGDLVSLCTIVYYLQILQLSRYEARIPLMIRTHTNTKNMLKVGHKFLSVVIFHNLPQNVK